MTRTETLAIMSVLKAAYPSYYRDMSRKDADGIVGLWESMFADIPAAAVSAAVRDYIANDKSGFPPHIGAIYGAINQKAALPAKAYPLREWAEEIRAHYHKQGKLSQLEARKKGIPFSEWEKS